MSRTIASLAPLRRACGRLLLDVELEIADQIEESRKRVLVRLDRHDRKVSLVLAGLFLVVAGAFAGLAPWERSFSWTTAVALAVAYTLVSRVEFEVGPWTVVPTQLIFVPMLFLLPLPIVPLVVAFCGLAGSAVDRVRGEAHLERAILVPTSSWFALGPALVLSLAGETRPHWSAWPVYVGALAAQLAVDFVGSTARGWFAFGLPPASQLTGLAWVAVLDAALAPAGFLAAVAAQSGSLAFLLLLPLVGLIAVLAQERAVRIDHALELGRAYRGTAILLGDVVEADDAYTGAHSRDVVSLALGVCRSLGVTGKEARLAEFTALLHDVGKIRVPASIINKPGPLDAAEWTLIKRHTIEGEQMLARVGGLLSEVGTVVRSCHEWYDGSGYPDGLAGDEIPRIARIVCCCDAFSAMTTDRSYRAAMAVPAALEELRDKAGSQFDPEVVGALLAVIEGLEAERPSVVPVQSLSEAARPRSSEASTAFAVR
jgi:HD-GYP domain-containing protein (c-di-GMP phosphodiesterase class II)